jgi:hypothetical protein
MHQRKPVARLEKRGKREIRTGDGDLDAIIETSALGSTQILTSGRATMRELEEMLIVVQR